jgi:phage shock protein A
MTTPTIAQLQKRTLQLEKEITRLKNVITELKRSQSEEIAQLTEKYNRSVEQMRSGNQINGSSWKSFV